MANKFSDNLKGMMVNLNAGLLFPFMLNPQPITIKKDVTWEIEEVPGLPAPLHYYQSGGLKTISFELFFDASEAAVSSGHTAIKDPTGTLGMESILESFLYPQATELSDFSLKKLIKQNKFVSPPIVFLVIGFRFWQGYVSSAPIEETKFDKLLFPTQFKAPIEFNVVEDGVINDINTGVRNSLSLLRSSLNAIDIVTNTVDNSINFDSFDFSIAL